MKKFFKITLRIIGGLFLLVFIVSMFVSNKSTSNVEPKTTKQKLEKDNVNVIEFKDNIKTSNQILVSIKVQSPKERLHSFNTTKVVKQVYNDYKDKGLKRIDVIVNADCVDKYGNEKLVKTRSAVFDIEELKKINWNHFNSNAIFNIASQNWINKDVK